MTEIENICTKRGNAWREIEGLFYKDVNCTTRKEVFSLCLNGENPDPVIFGLPDPTCNGNTVLGNDMTTLTNGGK